MTVVVLLAGAGIPSAHEPRVVAEDEMIVRWINTLSCRGSKHGVLVHP
jgi:hypothetical protein